MSQPLPTAESSPAKEPTGSNKTTQPSKQQVIDYLRRHPQFFMHEDELLAGLSLPHPSGKAVSLLERQVAVLRRRGQDARHKLHSLLSNARNNDQLFDTISKLVLALLRAEGIAAIVRTTQQQLLAQPNIDACEIILCDTLVKSAVKSAPQSDSSLRSLSAKKLQADYAEVFRLNHTHCGPLDEQRLGYLFPAMTVRSTALCPLSVSAAPALIALGNSEPDYFNVHIDTLFIDFIGDLLAALLEKAQRTV